MSAKKAFEMKILHISDTHGSHRRLSDLPEADVVVHSGDFTMTGSEQEALDFLNWFCDLPYLQKIFICGNHDECLYGAKVDGLDDNVHYLCNSGVEIGGVRFYGVPMFMGDCVTGRQAKHYANIPDDTDVLITHTVQPRLHLFGHIHSQHGITILNGTTFSNGAVMNADYSNLRKPNVIEYLCG